jgi:hypothetical protein
MKGVKGYSIMSLDELKLFPKIGTVALEKSKGSNLKLAVPL